MSEVALGANEESAAALRVERFEELWDRYAGAVYAFAARRIGPDRASDVVSETFIVAWRRFDDGCNIDLPWLYGVAHNVVRQSIRSADRF